MIAFAGLLPVFAAWRYHTAIRQIERGEARVDHGLILLVTTLVIFVAMVFILYLLKYYGKC